MFDLEDSAPAAGAGRADGGPRRGPDGRGDRRQAAPPVRPARSPGEAAAAENFPVASRLLRREARGPVLAFYAFARAADDVADDPDMPPADKLAGLDLLEAGLDGAPSGAPEGLRLRAALQGARGAQASEQARRVLSAFRQDARGADYPDWAALRDYCARSADPVGRFLLVLHGEDAAATGPSDALCTALQVLNHCQDLREDRDLRGRVYMPRTWLARAGATAADLSAPALTQATRRVLDRALDECDGLLLEARALPGAIGDRGLRGQAAATLWLAERLVRLLRRGDPLAGRVGLGRIDFALAGGAGLWAAAT
jgi:phytoene synthase